MQKFSILAICFLTIGCATRITPAPIENITNIPQFLLQNGNLNQVNKAPATASPVAQPTLTPLAVESNNSVKPIIITNISESNNDDNQSNESKVTSNSDWIIPTKGRTSNYSATNKGIEIYGTLGQTIYASHKGKVVYSGNGLKGYGNLIIIKHDDIYLTAYAQNKINLVKEGAVVSVGQPIAKMGQDDHGTTELHFELRKNGKPINPFTLIGN